MNSDELKSALSSGSITICVVGIGRIGLPTALSFANSGLLFFEIWYRGAIKN
jgi:UDP-N-acetyl-D-mannosaminuronate dehydrogenase